MGFQRTTAINKLLGMKKRKRVVQGGTWAGKTYGIMATLIDYCAKNRRKRVLAIAETLAAVKEGAMNDFKNIMIETERWVEDRWNATELKYTFANGTVLRFKAFDTPGKAKASGKWNVVFMNECNNIPFEIANVLLTRATDFILFDYNPDNEFWVHKEILTQEDSEFLLLKYSDNEACPDSIKAELNLALYKAYHDPYGDRNDPKNIRDPWWVNYCKVYIDGEIGKLTGSVFSNWSICHGVPEGAKLLGYGLDFGYTQDPTACVAVYEWNNKIVYDLELYEKGLLNSVIAAKLQHLNKQRIIYADSAEPKSIDELKLYGLNITATDKGADSVMFGIQKMQEREILITERSIKLIEEFRKYVWATNKQNEPLNVPIDHYNHGIDAARYLHLGIAGQIGTKKKYTVY